MKVHPKTSSARELVLDILEDVRRGRFAEYALSERLENSRLLSPEDRGLIAELVYGVLRWQARLDGIIRRCSDHPLSHIKPSVRQILRIGLYQLFLLDRVPDHAAVDEAAKLAQSRFGKPTVGFVNAVLRRALRERERVDPLPKQDAGSLAAYYSHPTWLVRQWFLELGPAHTERVLRQNNTRVPIVVRVNVLKTTPEQLAALWRSHGVKCEPVSGLPYALKITVGRGPVHLLPGFEEGLFVVQDAAAQIIAPLVRVQPGDRVLDACAAPGGKTSHLAAHAAGEASIIAVEFDPERVRDLEANLFRLGVTTVRVIAGDVSDPEFMRSLGSFDRVLLDPPCTNLGVLRHNPEARYRTKPGDSARFAEFQSRMLRAVSQTVRVGGTLVYSVCTVSSEETTGVIQQFLDEQPGFLLEPIAPAEVPSREFIRPKGYFNTFPSPRDFALDGFFAARLRRCAL
ncbi:MAG: 16S rRNA (cytosine(967)-C(5))-methyltransferase RsmB [Desulfomonile sp.]|nr:16S rRNA (cytosine(967)-C(5))-methyltransferase RsmB [Desulfomonile sp.]